jgi:hypothetical protein
VSIRYFGDILELAIDLVARVTDHHAVAEPLRLLFGRRGNRREKRRSDIGGDKADYLAGAAAQASRHDVGPVAKISDGFVDAFGHRWWQRYALGQVARDGRGRCSGARRHVSDCWVLHSPIVRNRFPEQDLTSTRPRENGVV